jgi:hypothetical protein
LLPPFSVVRLAQAGTYQTDRLAKSRVLGGMRTKVGTAEIAGGTDFSMSSCCTSMLAEAR